MNWFNFPDVISYSAVKFLRDSAILQITVEFFLINLQKPVKLQNFADFMKKFCGNLQNCKIRRTSQKCAKKVQKKCGELRILQFSADLHPKKFPDVGLPWSISFLRGPREPFLKKFKKRTLVNVLKEKKINETYHFKVSGSFGVPKPTKRRIKNVRNVLYKNKKKN